MRRADLIKTRRLPKESMAIGAGRWCAMQGSRQRREELRVQRIIEKSARSGELIAAVRDSLGGA
jgi:hypothetical protein